MIDALACLCLGITVAAGLYLVTARQVARIIFGMILLSHATNLYLLHMEHRVPGGRPAFLAREGGALVDPLPQALILTAIVIGFAVAGFMLALGKRMRELDAGAPDAREVEET